MDAKRWGEVFGAAELQTALHWPRASRIWWLFKYCYFKEIFKEIFEIGSNKYNPEFTNLWKFMGYNKYVVVKFNSSPITHDWSQSDTLPSSSVIRM